MSRASSKLLTGASGAAGGGPVYVEDVFSTTVYTGTDSSVVVPTGIDLADKGGMIWGKSRSGAQNHRMYDSVRGTQYSLIPNGTSAQSDQGTQTFGSSSVTLGAASGIVGSSSYGGPDYVLWSFAKQEKFFDIVTYTGDGNADRQINHNLGSVPGMMIIKKYVGSTTRWAVFHRSIGTGKFLSLDDTAAVATQSDFWETAPTATQFTVETNGNVNNNGDSYVAYLFGHNEADYGENSDEAIIKCGIYSGNSAGSATTDQTITLGFEPQWILIKKSTGGIGRWSIFDNMRGVVYGGSDKHLSADINNAEDSNAALRFDSTGFTLEGANWNYTDGTTAHEYIYMAIARPHKPASEFAATDLFTSANGLNASAGGKAYATTYPVDMHLAKNNNSSSGDWYLRDRLRGGNKYLNPNDPREENSHQYNNEFDHMDGVYTTTALNNTSSIGYSFRRAPEFFDVVTYTGVSSSTVVKHNLGVVPEMVWRKRRDASQQYYVWVSALSGSGTTQGQGNFYTNSMGFSNAQYFASDTQFAASTPPTATQFTQGALFTSGADYVAYLFASVAGISKIGTYTGTGYDIDVNCGFSSGARFVMVKSASHGHFYIWDTTRGLVAGSDPYLWLGSNSGQTTGDDYIDPLSTGFTITSSAPTELNSSGVTYAFLAIA